MRKNILALTILTVLFAGLFATSTVEAHGRHGRRGDDRTFAPQIRREHRAEHMKRIHAEVEKHREHDGSHR